MKYSFLLLIAAATLLGACESSQTETTARTEPSATEAANQAPAAVPSAEVPAAAAPATPAVAVKLDGSALYASTCQACHQASGQGLPNAFPSLVGSPRVNDAEGAQLVTIILNGYNERDEYGMMPGYASSMTDDKVAAVATHVRNSWGNTGTPVSADFVRKLRATTK
ncbi:c-type cytochrome [Hymenobacter sp. B1770]|uniref:c-type cytochrome n=1 Tax=Hymenobacter sp. B1770 TaxID=1718788 RepID=UPI003CF50BF5